MVEASTPPYSVLTIPAIPHINAFPDSLWLRRLDSPTRPGLHKPVVAVVAGIAFASVAGRESDIHHFARRHKMDRLTPLRRSLYEFLKKSPHASDEEIREGLSGNLCRCTGYENIVRAVRAAADALKNENKESAT